MIFSAPCAFYRMCAYKSALPVAESMCYMLAWCVAVKPRQAKASQVKSIAIRCIFIHWFKHITLYVRALSVICLVSFDSSKTRHSLPIIITSNQRFYFTILYCYYAAISYLCCYSFLHHKQTHTCTEFLVCSDWNSLLRGIHLKWEERNYRPAKSAIFTALCRFKYMLLCTFV